MIQNVGSQALVQLSTKKRPKKTYKTNRKDLDWGALDIHKAIGKLPRPASGWTLPGYKYTGPYNDLENQVRYNPMVKSLNAVPYKERQWGHWLARNLIITKQKLGLGLN